jgi:hypothetical protein
MTVIKNLGRHKGEDDSVVYKLKVQHEEVDEANKVSAKHPKDGVEGIGEEEVGDRRLVLHGKGLRRRIRKRRKRRSSYLMKKSRRKVY